MRSQFIVLIAVIASVLVTGLYFKNTDSGAASPKTETAYERVIRTGTIRCGYGVAAPYVEMDPNTKKMRGFAVDIMEAIGKNLNLNIEWTEETGWGGMPEALNAGRIDVGCSSLWMSAPISREALFSDVYLYNAMYFYVRADNDKFETLQDLETQKAKLTYIEGDNTQGVITKRMFPNNELLAQPTTMQSGEQILNVVNGKADALIMDPGIVANYNSKADIKLRALSPEKPAATVGNAFPLPKNETMLKNMIDTAIREMVASGEMAQIIEPYQAKSPNSFFVPAQPYSP